MGKLVCLLWGAALCQAATFGTAVPVRGTVSDIALDERRGLLYLADFSAGRIQVLRTSDLSFASPLPPLPRPASSLALSPDQRFLVAGHYEQYPDSPAAGGFTIFDLDAGVQHQYVLDSPVLAAAFGAGSQALVVTPGEFLLLDPASGRTQMLGANLLACRSLPVPLATFPPSILWASAGVSGDGQTIVVLARTGAPPCASADADPADSTSDAVITYRVGGSRVDVISWTTSPPLGPRAISVNFDASAFLTGSLLLDARGFLKAQFPYPTGNLRLGGVAWDWKRDRIYADIPVAVGEPPVLHVVDTDNLTVHERIRLPQTLAGRTLFSSDMQTLYAVADGGVVVLPVGSLDQAPRVVAGQEDVLFQAGPCSGQVVSQTLDLSDPHGGNVDFKLSLSSAAGIRITPDSGTTPATVRITVDPTAFQSAQATSIVELKIETAQGVNLPLPVRLLIHSAQPGQRGRLIHAPGKLVDILAERLRGRVYLVRQDKNLVLVYDTTNFQPIAALRTGNTPVAMAITADQRYLLVGNDNSQLISVFDLETLQPSHPILSSGVYPRTVGVALGAIWATGRDADPKRQGVYRVDFENRVTYSPPSLGVYCNSPTPGYCTEGIPMDAAMTASPSASSILLAIPDGRVALWDDTVGRWAVSRKDFTALGGAYGAFTDDRFLVDTHVLDQALYPIADLAPPSGISSGLGVAGGVGLRVSAGGTGTLERVDWMALQAYHATPTFEAPMTAANLKAAPIGQIGQTILPFTRSLAVPADQSSILVLGLSGLTVVPADFDAPVTTPVITAIVNAADGGAIAPGGLISIRGSGLADGAAAASGPPWPTELGGVCATVANAALPLLRVSPTEIVAQLPYIHTGAIPLILQTPAGLSNHFVMNIESLAPAVFHNGASGGQSDLATVVRLKNNDLATFTNPIHPEETIAIYLTGLGPTSPPVTPGQAAPLDSLSWASMPLTVTLGDTPLAITFAGLAPGQVGVYQINAYVPSGVADAAQAPLVITQGTASTTLYVRVVNP